MPALLEKLSNSFENIKSGGIKDNLAWNNDSEYLVLTEVLREGIHKELMIQLKAAL